MLQDRGESIAGNAARLRTALLPGDRAVVEAAADQILAATADGTLGRDLCIVPAGRARRLLLAALLETARARKIALELPRIELPKSVITVALEATSDAPAAIATDLEWSLALRDSIASMSSTDRAALIGEGLAANPPSTWRGAIDSIRKALDDFAAARRAPADAAAKVRGLGGDDSRYRGLHAVRDRARARLRDCDLIERDEWRELLILRGEPTVDRIWLVGMAELSPQLRAALRRCAAGGADVIALIAADERNAPMFDEFGCPTIAWTTAPIAIDEKAIIVADSARDQAEAALQAIANLAPRSAGDIAIGVADASLTPTLRRAAESAGLQLHDPEGHSFAKSLPARALTLLAAHLKSERSDSFAALVRHPNVRDALRRTLQRDPVALLDDALARTLSHRMPVDGTGVPDYIAPIARQVAALLGPFAARTARLLAEQAAALAKFLETIGPWPSDDAASTTALEAIIDALRELRDVPQAIAPTCDAVEAIEHALPIAQGTAIPDAFEPCAVEMLGWLELVHDRSPALVIVGMNEGRVPAGRRADAWLPDALRRSLDMPTADTRLARDKAILTQLLARCRHLILIVGRRDARGDPLAPSRAVLATKGEALARRVARLTDPKQSLGRDRRWPLRSVARTECELPLPPAPIALDRLSVTAFRSFFRCPRRFWLERIEGLKEVLPAPSELDPRDFGTLAHDVLSTLKGHEAGESSDPERVARFLTSTVDRLVLERFGDAPRTALLVQAASLKSRLERFARIQAAWAGAGWRIIETEYPLPDDVRLPMRKDEDPITISGRVDRIDAHPELGVRIIDFKCGERAKDPIDEHIDTGADGKPAWIDLQLPLYRDLLGPRLKELFAERVATVDPIHVGYVSICADLAEVKWREAKFATTMPSAIDTACEVVRRVRGGDQGITTLSGRDLDLDQFRYLLQTIALPMDPEDDEP